MGRAIACFYFICRYIVSKTIFFGGGVYFGSIFRYRKTMQLVGSLEGAILANWSHLIFSFQHLKNEAEPTL
jgi:hypothetical protein